VIAECTRTDVREGPIASARFADPEHGERSYRPDGDAGREWIDGVLRPALLEARGREWTRESFMEFHRSWNSRIHEGLVAGTLSLEQVDEAHALLDSLPPVPGVKFVRQSMRISGSARPGAGPVRKVAED
jgi:hypothetical protein